MQHVLERLAEEMVALEAHEDRIDLIRAAGFQVDELERSRWGLVERVSAHKV